MLYKRALDRVLPAEMSEVVMDVKSGEAEYAVWRRDRDAEERLLDRFRDPDDPLKILIVTSKLLTGFDAPILQAMYLDKPLRDHTLLQAICRTNRPYGDAKTHGLIVDYLGVFDDVAQAIQFDEEGITRVVTNLNELAGALPAAVRKCLAWFPGVDRSVTGYAGLIAAQECLPDGAARDGFAADYSVLSRLWEAVSLDASLEPYEADYRWLSQVYESMKPSTGTGRLLWHALGPQTVEIIQRHVHVDGVRDDLETLVLDADVLDAVLGAPDPDGKSKEIEIKVADRLRRHLHDPRFKALGERLEALRRKHEQGLLVSIEFLKSLLDLARDVVEAERTTPPATPEERGKAALTELFEEARNDRTPIMVERVVNDIDEIVRHVRFEGWQTTHAGERQVKQVLRKDPVQVPAAPGPGAVRPRLRLHPAVLLTSSPDPRARATWPCQDAPAGCIVRPPTTVRTTPMFLMSSGSASCGSRSRMTKSASLPAVIDFTPPMRSHSSPKPVWTPALRRCSYGPRTMA